MGQTLPTADDAHFAENHQNGPTSNTSANLPATMQLGHTVNRLVTDSYLLFASNDHLLPPNSEGFPYLQGISQLPLLFSYNP